MKRLFSFVLLGWMVMIGGMIHAQSNKATFRVTYRDFRGFLVMESGGNAGTPAAGSEAKPVTFTTNFHPHFDNQHLAGIAAQDYLNTTANSNIIRIRPMVENKTVIEEGSGIPKLQYCLPSKRVVISGGTIPVCGAPLGSDSKYAFGQSPRDDEFAEQGFNAWYRDTYVDLPASSNLTRFNNKRKGDTITLTKQPSGTFKVSNGSFFPIDNSNLIGAWGENDETFGDEGNKDSGGTRHNFGFTTEMHTFFQYKGGEIFTFTGDDDLWVFVNDSLALDLGGLHSSETRSLVMDAFSDFLRRTTGKGLVINEIYGLSMYHAERHTKASNFGIETTIASPCNAVSKGIRQIDLVSANVTAQFKQVGGTGYGEITGSGASRKMTLVTSSRLSSTGYVFFTKSQNTGAGFVSTFSFKASANSQGFAFVIQDDRLVDFNGGTGANLGTRNFKNCLAVVFDFCTSRPNACGTKNSEIRIHAVKGDEIMTMSDSTKIANATLHKGAVFNDNLNYEVVVQYLFSPPVLEVYVDNSLYIQKRNFKIEEFIGSKAGFMGFTSGNGVSSSFSGTVEISKWIVDAVTINDTLTNLVTDTEIQQVIKANERDRASFMIRNVDTCENDIEFGGFQNRIVAFFSKANDSSSSSNGTSIPAIVIDHLNGSYSLQLETKEVGEFDLYVQFGENCLTQSCFVRNITKAVKSTPLDPPLEEPPTEEGVPESALIGIGVAVGVIVGLGSLFGLFFFRHRRRWRKEKQFIEEGKLAKMNQGIVMQGDASLEAVAKKLQETREEINMRKGANLNGKDLSGDIEKLEQQKNELQNTLKEMKQKNQTTTDASRDVSKPAQTGRKMFGPVSPDLL